MQGLFLTHDATLASAAPCRPDLVAHADLVTLRSPMAPTAFSGVR